VVRIVLYIRSTFVPVDGKIRARVSPTGKLLENRQISWKEAVNNGRKSPQLVVLSQSAQVDHGKEGAYHRFEEAKRVDWSDCNIVEQVPGKMGGQSRHQRHQNRTGRPACR
jgi:hypothetical protein